MKNKKLFIVLLSIILIIILIFIIYYIHLKRTTFKVELEYVVSSYLLNINYIEPSEEYVRVKGNSKILNNIKTIKGSFDFEEENINKAGVYEIEVLLVAYDDNGKIIDNVNIVPRKINVSVSVD